MKIYLASKSPRRKEILSMLLSEFYVLEQNFNEDNVLYNGNPVEYVKEISTHKVNWVKDVNEDEVYISFDTIVFAHGKILGKPKNEEEALEMLKFLSSKWHEVYTGIAVKLQNKTIVEYEKTNVKFSVLEEDDIKKYISTKSPFDKAGGYGIQDYGGTFVEEIKGCFYNVMGLPINKLKKMFIELNII